MGWHVAPDGIWWHDETGSRCGYGEFPAALPAIIGTRVLDGQRNSDGGRRCVFSPTTNIAHAISALDYWASLVSGRDWTCAKHSAFFRPGMAKPGAYTCALDDSDGFIEQTYAETLPLAICRVLIRAARGQ
jgi:hypothetical protein